MKVFLRLNGYEIEARPRDAYRFLLDIAMGKVSAVGVDKWVAMNLTHLKEE